MLRQSLPVMLLAGCGVGVDGFSPGDGWGEVTVGEPVANDLPCEVAAMVTDKCVGCHSTPPTQSAPFELLSYADFAAPSPSSSGQTVAQRSLTRMKAAQNPMPP